MNNKTTHIAILTLLAGTFLLAGCGDDYGQDSLGPDSPEFRAIAKMLQDLRASGEQGLAEQIRQNGASGVSPEILEATLLELLNPDEVTLVSLDRFGEKTYRAIFRCESDDDSDESDESKDLVILLVTPDDDNRFYWAGRK